MRVHSFKWFKKNCRFEVDGYCYKNEIGRMPLRGLDLCGKKVIKKGNQYIVPEGVQINGIVMEEFTFMPEWFFDKRERLEIE